MSANLSSDEALKLIRCGKLSVQKLQEIDSPCPAQAISLSGVNLNDVVEVLLEFEYRIMMNRQRCNDRHYDQDYLEMIKEMRARIEQFIRPTETCAMAKLYSKRQQKFITDLLWDEEGYGITAEESTIFNHFAGIASQKENIPIECGLSRFERCMGLDTPKLLCWVKRSQIHMITSSRDKNDIRGYFEKAEIL